MMEWPPHLPHGAISMASTESAAPLAASEAATAPRYACGCAGGETETEVARVPRVAHERAQRTALGGGWPRGTLHSQT
jgi:hypothetical protein